MGEPVNLPGHANDKHLFAKVQICSGWEGLWGQSLRLLTTPIIKNQLCLWFQDAVLGELSPQLHQAAIHTQNHLHLSLSSLSLSQAWPKLPDRVSHTEYSVELACLLLDRVSRTSVTGTGTQGFLLAGRDGAPRNDGGHSTSPQTRLAPGA